jgi:hypothetical protein
MSPRLTKFVAGAAALALLAFSAASPALAASACFRSADIEADQALRYQSKLMVLSDTCGGDAYRDFTVRNRDLIVFYQHQLAERFRRIGATRPEASLDSFLTRIANEDALREGVEPRQVACSRGAEFLAQARTLDRDTFPRYVAGLAAANRSTYRTCQ